MTVIETPENFTSFLEETGTKLVNKIGAEATKKNEDLPQEIKAIYLAFLENQEAVMDQIASLLSNETINQEILGLFIEKIGKLGEIIDQERNKSLDELNIDTSNNIVVKQILKELSEEKFNKILIALKKL